MRPPEQTRWYTRKEAAPLCDTSVDTIERRQKAGLFPNARQRPGDRNGTWEIPLNDLVNAGLYELSPGGADEAGETVARLQAARALGEVRAELIEERARREALELLLEEQKRHARFLEKTVERLTTGGDR